VRVGQRAVVLHLGMACRPTELAARRAKATGQAATPAEPFPGRCTGVPISAQVGPQAGHVKYVTGACAIADVNGTVDIFVAKLPAILRPFVRRHTDLWCGHWAELEIASWMVCAQHVPQVWQFHPGTIC
jgi:hypothetical protein